jgi:hypothetical protein
MPFHFVVLCHNNAQIIVWLGTLGQGCDLRFAPPLAGRLLWIAPDPNHQPSGNQAQQPS